MKLKQWIESFVLAAIILLVWHGVSPAPPLPPPPPSAPAGGGLAQLLTVGAIAAYGTWRIRRKK